jgi:hypothetical protein
MSLRLIWLVVVAALACAGSSPPRSDEPTTAKDKQRRDAEAAGTLDSGGGKWSGWRYTGDRNDCFFVVGRRCFKTEATACAAARCGKRPCKVVGGGPAAVRCDGDQ